MSDHLMAEANHYAWVARSIEQYLDRYEPEVTGDLRKLTEARLRISIIEHCPAPSQMTPREVELRAEVERLKAELGSLHGKIGLLAKELTTISDNAPTEDCISAIRESFHAMLICVEIAGAAKKQAEARAERAEADTARLRERIAEIGNTARIAYGYSSDTRCTAHVLSIMEQARAALAKEGKP